MGWIGTTIDSEGTLFSMAQICRNGYVNEPEFLSCEVPSETTFKGVKEYGMIVKETKVVSN